MESNKYLPTSSKNSVFCFLLSYSNCCYCFFLLKIDESMPHYLRMLTYARQPDEEWGPIKNENRFGRYKPKIDKSAYLNELDMVNDNSNLTSNSKDIFRVQL